MNVRDLQATQRGAGKEISIDDGSLLSIYNFDTTVRVREPNYGDVCLSLCMLVVKDEVLGFGPELREKKVKTHIFTLLDVFIIYKPRLVSSSHLASSSR